MGERKVLVRRREFPCVCYACNAPGEQGVHHWDVTTECGVWGIELCMACAAEIYKAVEAGE